MRGGGEGSFGGCSDSLEKNFRIPDLAPVGASLRSSSSASEGTGDRDERDERSEESSSAAAMALRLSGRCDGGAVWVKEGGGRGTSFAQRECGCTKV